MEERYLKINSCRNCPYTGHSSSKTGSKYGFVFVCGNQINNSDNIPKEKISKEYYPITGYGNKFEDNVIPVWCKLPKEVI